MKYKGYTGTIEPDEDSGVLFGRVIGLRDVITFEGDTIPELIQAFHDSVDDYLAFCAERGESPEKPYSGQFVLRISPQLHRDLSVLAEEKTTSLNSLISDMLEQHAFFAQWMSVSPSFGKEEGKTSKVTEKKQAVEKVTESESDLREHLRDEAVSSKVRKLRSASTKKK
jgi:predicted HicB family RNase H-like nuclease